MDQLGDFEWITLLDLADSYHQFKLKEEDQIKTAFTINGKQWMFRVVPFGLKIMTGHMQRIMERLLKDLGVSPFQDDTAIASKNVEDHVQLVKKVLERITYDAGLRLKLKKCKFFQTEARVLGFYVTRNGLKMDPKKIKAITEWPRPKDGKGIQRFMGAANFNRDFSEEFARIAAPLDECRNDRVVEWTEERIQAFEMLKELFSRNLELMRIDWNKKIYLTSDASQIGVGAWLGQLDERGELMPVICASKKFNNTQQRWPATKRELYAVMWAMNKFRQYLIGRHFIARVDHKPLVSLLKNKSTMLTEGWLETIMQYTFTTEYLPGEENGMADALSRSSEGEINAINVNEENALDEQWIGEQKGLKVPSIELRKELIEIQHALGHFGAKLLSTKIQEEGYWWREMMKDIEAYTKECLPCLKYNVEKEGFHPAKSIVAKEPWDHIQIDLIGPLPVSERGHTYILTVVDVCTNFTVLRALKNKDMETIARKLWRIFSNFGTAKIIQSDNGAEFVNQVVKTLTMLYGIDHRLSTAYHPRANGLVERRNKEVSKTLKKFTEGTYAAWQDWLPLVQISLNEAISQRTGSAAFALMFGRKFNGFYDFSKVEEIEDWNGAFIEVKEEWNKFKDAVLPGLEKRVLEVKKSQEERLNERKQVEELKPGTLVMAIDPNKASKWDPVYQGPYTVKERNKGGAYTLINELGEEMLPRRTIEMLKPVQQSSKLADRAQSGSNYEVERVMDHRKTTNGDEYLVKWRNYFESDNSWVKASNFNNVKPIKEYWRKKRELKKQKKQMGLGTLSTKGLGGSHVKPSQSRKANSRKKPVKASQERQMPGPGTTTNQWIGRLRPRGQSQ